MAKTKGIEVKDFASGFVRQAFRILLALNVSRSALFRFCRQQALGLGIAAIIAAVFWANNESVRPLTIVVYSILFGNIIPPVMRQFRFLYWTRSFPYNWLLYLVVLLLVVAPIYAICSVAVWWIAPPAPQTLFHLITTGWKFPAVVIVTYGLANFLYESTGERLEQRNRELQRRVQEGTEELAMQKQELARAREIQQSLLPKKIPQISGFEVATAWRPARAVSGDYFDVFRLGEHRIAVCIADVVGKGVSAALLMANVQAAVHAFAYEQVSPVELCTKVNRLLCENIATGKFVTFLFGVLDCNRRAFVYCNAGHPAPLLVSFAGARFLNTAGAVLGVFPGWVYEEDCVQLSDGDRLVLFTDGITEAEGPDGSEFAENRLAASALANFSRSASELNGLLLSEVESYCGGHFQDDATLLVIAAK